MLQTFFSGFKPQSTKEWVLLALVLFLLLTLYAFYKALMNCKTTIESYVDEQRSFKSYYETSSEFIAYCNTCEPDAIQGYCEDSGQTQIEFLTKLKRYGDENARIL